jgi:hypothetical protein
MRAACAAAAAVIARAVFAEKIIISPYAMNELSHLAGQSQ